MKKEIIEKIIRNMKSELTDQQLSKLTSVCYEAINETDLNEAKINYIDLFLASKKN